MQCRPTPSELLSVAATEPGEAGTAPLVVAAAQLACSSNQQTTPGQMCHRSSSLSPCHLSCWQLLAKLLPSDGLFFRSSFRWRHARCCQPLCPPGRGLSDLKVCLAADSALAACEEEAPSIPWYCRMTTFSAPLGSTWQGGRGDTGLR